MTKKIIVGIILSNEAAANVVASNDGVALGLIRGLADHGIKVPDALNIIGFDGISMDDYSVPSISTMALDMDDFATKATGLLLSRIRGEYSGPPRRLQTKYTLVARESTGRRFDAVGA
jgi:DNA-binding LacI/PurR family transcriptional regulator